MSAPDPFTKSSLFEHALRAILRPLIRALIAQGVTAPALYRIIKRSYVEVAAAELKDQATDSRISIATGVHRRDVKTIRAKAQPDQSAVRRKVSTLATVIGRWMSDPNLQTADGSPKALPRSSDTSFDFEQLVQEVSRDIRPRAVLEELKRQALVTEEDDQIHLNPEALVGPADLDQKLHFFAHNIGDHMSAAVENLLSDTPPFLERAVFFNRLTEASVDTLEKEARALAGSALREINALASARQRIEKDGPEATHRFRFGVYFLKDDEGPAGTGVSEDESKDL